MSQWESQLRTNLEDPAYGKLLDNALASVPGTLAAGLVNTRYEEGCLHLPRGEVAPAPQLERLVLLTRGLFPLAASIALPERYAASFAELGPVESVYWTTRDERLFAWWGPNERVVVMSVSATLRQGAALILLQDSTAELEAGEPGGFARVFEGLTDVLAAGLLNPAEGTFEQVFRRTDNRSEFAFDEAMGSVVGQFFHGAMPPSPVVFLSRAGKRLEVLNMQISSASLVRSWWTVPFDPEHLMFLEADRQTVAPGLLWAVANRTTEETVRVWADGLLAWGIDAILEPFPKTQREFLEIVEELRHLHHNDLIARLRIGGFANYSMGEGEDIQRCQECIYYHPHRKWCDLPELPIPVEPHWWCRLWKL